MVLGAIGRRTPGVSPPDLSASRSLLLRSVCEGAVVQAEAFALPWRFSCRVSHIHIYICATYISICTYIYVIYYIYIGMNMSGVFAFGSRVFGLCLQ